ELTVPLLKQPLTRTDTLFQREPVAGSSLAGGLFGWDLETGKAIKVPVPEGAAQCVTFPGWARKILLRCPSALGDLIEWDYAFGKEPQRIQTGGRRVTSAAASPDGSAFVVSFTRNCQPPAPSSRQERCDNRTDVYDRSGRTLNTVDRSAPEVQISDDG